MQDVTFPVATLAPSEVIYLASIHFPRVGGSVDEKRAIKGALGLKEGEYVQRAYSAAFLAAEAAGMLRLEIRQKKAMMGLRTVEALYADPTGNASAYPPNALESLLLKSAEEICKKEPPEAWHAVYRLLGSDSIDPWGSAAGAIQAALVARNLLTTTTTTRLRIFKSTHHWLPEQTATQAEQKIGEVQRMLQDCEASRPEVWQALRSAISTGINKRKAESPDVSMPDAPA